MERQLQNTEGIALSDLTVWSNSSAKGTNTFATRPDNELANTLDRIRDSSRILGGEAFVNVPVAVQNDVGPGAVEQLPEIQDTVIGCGRPR